MAIPIGGALSYVLTLSWIWASGADASLHTSVYMDTFATVESCRTLGERWLSLPAQLHRPIAYSCPAGRTAYARQQGGA